MNLMLLNEDLYDFDDRVLLSFDDFYDFVPHDDIDDLIHLVQYDNLFRLK